MAVIINGSLPYRREVRQSLFAAAAILPSLDAGTAARYRRINRPHLETTLTEAVMAIIARHPMRREGLERALAAYAPVEIDRILVELVHSGHAQVVERLGAHFLSTVQGAGVATNGDARHTHRHC